MASSYRTIKRSRSPSEQSETSSPPSYPADSAQHALPAKRPHIDHDASGDESQVDVPRSSPFAGGDGGPSSAADEQSDLENGRRGSYHEPDPDEPSVQCLWHNCGRRYTELHGLIDHLHIDHIGTHKKRYTCEWVGCSRKSRTQTSRFALLSHLRSHTGEKPFTCPLVDCDKSFTRSDALAKHMRAQHQMVPIPTRRAKPRRSLRKPGEQGSDSEEEAVEMVTLSDYEPLDKPPVVVPAGARGRRFSDAALGIVRDPLGSESEEVEIRQVRSKTALLMQAQHGIGSGTIADGLPGASPGSSSSSPASTDLSADEDETEDERISPGSPPLRRPNPLDLINNTTAGLSGDAKNGKCEGDRKPARTKQQPKRSQKDYKKRYLVSKAKYQFLQAEHHELARELAQLRDDYEAMQEYKSDELNAALELELGEDVEAIFSPPGTPPPMQSFTEQRGGPPFGY